ncbi:coleoptile phototropism protein 1-like [Oryza glaberrima]|nr:coleoptile phototropism protein 1-like [Oryza glaberrima]
MTKTKNSDTGIDKNCFIRAYQAVMVPKCGYIRKAVAAARGGITTTVEFDLSTLPGGVDAFDKAARDCYGANFQLSVRNAAALLCASAFLDMQPPLARWPDASTRPRSWRQGRAPWLRRHGKASAPASRGEVGEAVRQPPGPLPTRGCLAPLRPGVAAAAPASSGLARAREAKLRGGRLVPSPLAAAWRLSGLVWRWPGAGEEGEAARRRCDHGGFGRRAAGN